MLSALLQTIKSQFSKGFWLGSMLPLVVFLFGNALMLKRHSTVVSNWLATADALEEKTRLYGTILLAIFIAAYVLSILSSALLDMLEGRYGPLYLVAWPLRSLQYWVLKGIDRDYDTAQTDLSEVRAAAANWQSILIAAGRVGHGTTPQKWLRRQWELRWIWPLRLRRNFGRRIRKCDLEPVVARLAKLLGNHSLQPDDTFDRARLYLLDTIQHAINRAQFERIRLFNLRQFSYPGVRQVLPSKFEASTNSIVAPTRLGNIGRTMRSYALIRYEFDLDIFWTRLLNTLQKKAGDYYAVVQDGKTQLDCMVTLVWLTGIFTVSWSVALFRYCQDATLFEFLLTGLGGTLLTWIWYNTACQSYRVFADLVRSCVDLYRFELLLSLHVSPPYGSEEERQLWRRLSGVTGFASQQEPVIYKHTTI